MYADEDDTVVTCRAVDIKPIGNTLEPILVNFEHAHLKSSEAPSFKAAAFIHKDGKAKGRKRRIVAMAVDDMTYIGRSFDSPLADDSLCRSMLGFRNKASGEMKIVEVSTVLLSPFIGRDEPVAQEKENVPSTYSEKMSKFVKSFGTKMGKRKYEQAEQFKVNIEDMEDNLNEAMSSVNVKAEDLPTPAKPEIMFQELIPPCNRAATTPEDVYNISDILDDVTFSSLDGAADWVFSMDKKQLEVEKENLKLSDYFVVTTLAILNSEKSENEKRHKLKILVYIECLIQLVNKKYTDLRKNSKDPFGGLFPGPVATRALDTFTEGKGRSRTRSQIMKDKNMCYVLVLALIVGNYTIDLNLFTAAFKIHLKKLINFCQIVGATVITAQNIAQLKLPLVVAAVEDRGPRRKSQKK